MRGKSPECNVQGITSQGNVSGWNMSEGKMSGENMSEGKMFGREYV